MSEKIFGRIQLRRGKMVDLSGVVLNSSELGFATDEGRLFIGARSSDGAPLDTNIEILTTNTPSDPELISINNQTGTSYTIQISDINKIIEMENPAANTIVIPSNDDVQFPVGSKIDVIQQGAGTTTVSPAAGVTVNSSGGLLDIASQYSAISLIKRSTNEWTVVGSLA